MRLAARDSSTANRVREVDGSRGGQCLAARKIQPLAAVRANHPRRNSALPMIPTIKRTLLTFTSIAAMSFTSLAADESKGDADNTKKNERDRSGESKTSGDQSNSPEDLKITQSIRQAVVKDESLTMTAKNVKIITAGGQVTLRGPVKSTEEKTKIETIATATAGKGKVDNQLEVKSVQNK